MRTIAIWNRSTLVKDAELPAACAAFARYLTEHVEPAWNVGPVQVLGYLSTEQPPGGAEVLHVVDDCDQAGALGYHTDPGIPSGIVGVKTATDDGVAWTVVVGHELAEMLCDPECNRSVQVGPGEIEALEVCDAVEGYIFSIDGVQVPDFVLPAYYQPGSPGPWDYLGKLTGPLTLGDGGYVSKAPLGQWTQTMAEKTPAYRKKPHPLSRSGRRLASVPPEAPLSEHEALRKLQLACSGSGTDEERCCAVDALRQVGWTCEHASQWTTSDGQPFAHDGLTLTLARPK